VRQTPTSSEDWVFGGAADREVCKMKVEAKIEQKGRRFQSRILT
jgi:hypothetical protein